MLPEPQSGKFRQSSCGFRTSKIFLVIFGSIFLAYRPGRAQKIAKLFDLLLTILPFEPPYFERHGLKTIFIGHPIVEDIVKSDGADFRIRHQIKPDDILICLTPGSRSGEVKRILPEMIGAINILAKKYHNLKVAIPAIDKTYEMIKERLSEFKSEIRQFN